MTSILFYCSIGLFVTAFVAYHINRAIKTLNHCDNIYFKNSYDLTGLPIITFYQGETPYNFLLDTGSTSSHIDKRYIESGVIKGTISNKQETVTGFNGAESTSIYYNVCISNNNKVFESMFLASPLAEVFDKIKRENGVTLHGIIGTRFMDKYNYLIDFSKYIACRQ